MSAAWHGRAEKCIKFWWANLKERGHSEDLGIDGTMILRLIKWQSGIM